MWKLSVISIVTIFFSSAFASGADETKIVGGFSSDLNEFPYQVGIFKNGNFHCGGSIIAENWVLSAAHCFKDRDPSLYKILAGSTQLNSTNQKYDVATVSVHMLYILYTNDISLIKLNESLTFGESINKIDLPNSDTEPETEVVLSGWGLTSYDPNVFTNELQKINLVTITNSKCRSELGQFIIPNSDICTFTKKGEGACHGDSGGPLVDPKNKWLVGIVSGGIPCAKGKPDVFTRVYNYLAWIKKHMGQFTFVDL